MSRNSTDTGGMIATQSSKLWVTGSNPVGVAISIFRSLSAKGYQAVTHFEPNVALVPFGLGFGPNHQ